MNELSAFALGGLATLAASAAAWVACRMSHAEGYRLGYRLGQAEKRPERRSNGAGHERIYRRPVEAKGYVPAQPFDGRTEDMAVGMGRVTPIDVAMLAKQHGRAAGRVR
jgi:hypothetical protein